MNSSAIILILIVLSTVCTCKGQNLDINGKTSDNEVSSNDDIKSNGITAKEFLAAMSLKDEESSINDTVLLCSTTARFGVKTRSAVQPNARWPGNEIPYVITNGFNEQQRQKIAKTMMRYGQETCIRFVPREKAKNKQAFIKITPASGDICSSATLGFTKLAQSGGHIVKLSPRCFGNGGTVFHELMHVAGFGHEQTRPDRDKFVKILWENIGKSKEDKHQYEIDPNSRIIGNYDYESVMHYPGESMNGKLAIKTINPQDQKKIGQRNGPSPQDIQKLNQLYECPKGGGGVKLNSGQGIGRSGVNGGGATQETVAKWCQQTGMCA